VRSLIPALHFIASAAVAVLLLLIQSYVLAAYASPWLHADLLAIFVFYVGLEHHALSAVSKITFVSLLAELWSSVPAGFFLTSHLLMVLVGNRLATWLEMQRRPSQLLLFALLLLMKEGLFGLTASTLELPFAGEDFLDSRLPALLVSLVIAVPIMEMMASIDGRFERGALSLMGAARIQRHY
jgi:hypothetical protein